MPGNPFSTAEALDALAKEFNYDVELTRPDPHHLKYQRGWRPKLNPIQQQAVSSKAIYKLYHGERGSGKCARINDLCYIGDGLSRLGGLNPGVLFGWAKLKISVWSFDGNQMVVSKTEGFYREEKREAIKCRLENGHDIVGSPIHPIWCCVWKEGMEPLFRYVRLQEMQAMRDAGIRLWTPLVGHPSFSKTEYAIVEGVVVDEEIGYMLGALCGDGSLNQDKGRREFGFSNTDCECIDRVRFGLQKIRAELHSVAPAKGRNPCQFTITKSSKLRLLVERGRLAHLSYSKAIPDYIISSPKPVLAAFMRGLFDTDGTVEQAGTVSFTTTSEQLGIDVQNVLMAFGIVSVRRQKKSASGRPTWNVYIMGEEAAIFGKEIGFGIARKQQRIRFGLDWNRNKYGYPDAIKAVMESVCKQERPNYKGLRTPVKFKKKIKSKGSRWGEPREVWLLNRKFPWGMEIHQVESKEEAEKIEIQLTEKYENLIRGVCRPREWHDANRSALQAYLYVPSRKKLEKFMEFRNCRELFSNFLISDHWAEVVDATQTTAELADLCVADTHSFLCSGTINHNTIGALHELVDFLYRNDNELAYIVVKEIGMGTDGGAWHKLILDILPGWRDGIGIDFSEGNDFRTKSPYAWISNMHGGWSMAMLKSMPVADQVETKIKGREPGMIVVDEAQTLESDTYFTNLLMQLGRRRSNSEPSKIIFCCNPEGPSHWLYKRFFQIPVNEDTGEWDERYAHFHIPYSDNKENLPAGYYENYVIPAVANDPIAKRRLVDGDWIDRPDADAMFIGNFVENVHVRGDFSKNIGLLPVAYQNAQMLTGWDPGSAHTCVHFVQIVPLKDRIWKLCIDELDYVGQYTPYEKVAREVIERMRYWEDKCKVQFRWEHISDDSAFNVFRPGTGSYDVQDIEKHSRLYVERKGYDQRFIIKMKAAPKGEFSIAARVRMLTDDLANQDFLMSATCTHTKDMFLFLPEDPENRGNPKKKSRYLHNFSSLTYPLFYYHCRRIEKPGTTDKVEPKYYSV